jgi:hypothetical protein
MISFKLAEAYGIKSGLVLKYCMAVALIMKTVPAIVLPYQDSYYHIIKITHSLCVSLSFLLLVVVVREIHKTVSNFYYG